ncbi:DUF2334 domain-containing protein [Clostridium sp. BL-8]|uniref:DUF2334 domain-containing protein n=1 Tax=Clostridium sp. BL-8 TaxID=349938 RepID=UPI00098BE730|nr:DUF2334 domain-containing protein [Clostridium sp. BL-8]OOM77100.1 hypothetical protein CLOBL_31030 [Clostridium sp. BL-8]
MTSKRLLYIFMIILILLSISCSNNSLLKNNSSRQISNEDSLKKNDGLNIDFSSFTGFDMPKDNVKFIINGKTLKLNLPIYLDKNRYYISLNEFIQELDGKIKKRNDNLVIRLNNDIYTIYLHDNIIKSPNNNFPLKKPLLVKDNFYYIGLSDFSRMLKLYTRWDKDNKIINCKIDGFPSANIIPYKSKIKQIGLIRFEDIGVNSQPYSKEYFEKLRIIADYINQKKIPYHIAWIPRYVIPSQKVDNDPLTKNNFEIAEMVYSLDFFTTHNGSIGLHGYTHQSGNTESGAGFEFGKLNPSESTFKEKIERAIKTASYLDIPIDFFEAPHYEITPAQNKIAEKYFKILYYPFNDFGKEKADLKKPQRSPYNKSSFYISTPLDYIPAKKEEETLAKIKETSTNNMGSVFFHPFLENDYISLTEDDNSAPTFTYAENSILKRLISILEEKGFKMIKVTDL